MTDTRTAGRSSHPGETGGGKPADLAPAAFSPIQRAADAWRSEGQQTMNKTKIKVTDKATPLRTRIREVYQPGMTINDLAYQTRGKVDKIKAAVRKLRAEGFIKDEVGHVTRGEVIRAMNAGLTLTAAQRAAFRREVPEDMLAQIAAFPVKKIQTLPPGIATGTATFFSQVGGGMTPQMDGDL